MTLVHIAYTFVILGTCIRLPYTYLDASGPGLAVASGPGPGASSGSVSVSVRGASGSGHTDDGSPLIVCEEDKAVHAAVFGGNSGLSEAAGRIVCPFRDGNDNDNDYDDTLGLGIITAISYLSDGALVGRSRTCVINMKANCLPPCCCTGPLFMLSVSSLSTGLTWDDPSSLLLLSVATFFPSPSLMSGVWQSDATGSKWKRTWKQLGDSDNKVDNKDNDSDNDDNDNDDVDDAADGGSTRHPARKTAPPWSASGAS